MNAPEKLTKYQMHRLQIYTAVFDKLQGRDFPTRRLCAVISMTDSGTKRYRREMIAADVMFCIRKEGNEAIYRLTTDQAKIETFLALLNEGGRAVSVLTYPGDGKRPKRVKEDAIRAPTIVNVCRHYMDKWLFGDGPAPSLETQC
jgi:hypothetical protein